MELQIQMWDSCLQTAKALAGFIFEIVTAGEETKLAGNNVHGALGESEVLETQGVVTIIC